MAGEPLPEKFWLFKKLIFFAHVGVLTKNFPRRRRCWCFPPTSPDFFSTYLFKKTSAKQPALLQTALYFTKSKYFMVIPNHRQVSRAYLVLGIVSGATTMARE
jgi:hypothetical protein